MTRHTDNKEVIHSLCGRGGGTVMLLQIMTKGSGFRRSSHLKPRGPKKTPPVQPAIMTCPTRRLSADCGRVSRVRNVFKITHDLIIQPNSPSPSTEVQVISGTHEFLDCFSNADIAISKCGSISGDNIAIKKICWTARPK